MTGPHLIIIAICLTSALMGLWLVRQKTDHRIGIANLSLSHPVDQPVVSADVICRAADHVESPVTDPVQVVRQACLAMEEQARRSEIDLLRPFSVSVPQIDVPRGPLVALLKTLLQNTLEATPRKGAVICMIKMTANHVHFVVSDSSGCAEDGAALLSDTRWRTESLSPAKLVVEALGGRLLHTDHPGEGVVIDVAFERVDVKNLQEAKSFTAWSSDVSNDYALDRETFAARRRPVTAEAALQ